LRFIFFLPERTNNCTIEVADFALIKAGLRKRQHLFSAMLSRCFTIVNTKRFVAKSIEDRSREAHPAAIKRRDHGEYFLPLLKAFGFEEFLRGPESAPDSVVDVDFCARNNWFVGSPDTVATKIEKVYSDVGGFGHLLLFCFDYVEQPSVWQRSMELLASEVMPRLTHLTGN
jgi:alkanesulfonate monooxygenase SsuD/methylene tetrahydromethanopterin reductase-like flavin-dependent oxidoreductase (luciferase family)